MEFSIKVATKQQAYMKLGLSGVSGSGKTYSAILLAKGLVGDLSKVVIIDTENGSANLYSQLGNFNVLRLAEYSPENYIDAIKYCVKQGFKCIIIDSISHEWQYLVADDVSSDKKIKTSSMTSFNEWGIKTPRQNAFRDTIQNSPCHIITTTRRKQEYAMVPDITGKARVEKLGMKEIMRDDWEYELTINLVLDREHLSIASKDRTGLFEGVDPFLITESTGILIKNWCNEGVESIDNTIYKIGLEIDDVTSINELKEVFNKYPELQKEKSFKEMFSKRKREITTSTYE